MKKINKVYELNGIKVKCCPRCSVTKHVTEYYPCLRGIHKISSYCKDCIRKLSYDYNEQNPEKVKARNRNWHTQNPDRQRK